MSKRSSKKVKKDRRRKEILKAQRKSGLHEEYLDETESISTGEPNKVSQPRKITHRLPLKEIKTDLMKTAIYVVLVIVLLIILKSQGLEFNFIINK